MKKNLGFKFINIAFLLIIVVISTTAFTLSWYASNAQVEANDATLIIDRDTQASAEGLTLSEDEYSGETGKTRRTTADAPFVSELQLKITVNSNTSTPKLSVNLTRLIITKYGIDDASQYIVNTTDVHSDFTIRLYDPTLSSPIYYKRNSAGEMVNENNEQENMPFTNGENVYNMQVIFLNETDYSTWIQDNIRCSQDYSEYASNTSTPLDIDTWIQSQKDNDGNPKYFNYEKFQYSHVSFMFTDYYISFKYTIIE